KIDKRLRQHDGFASRSSQKVNRGQKRRIAGDARIRGKKLPVGVEAVNSAIQPVAGQLFVVGRIARIEREAPDEKEAQRKSGEERGQEVFVERFGEHGVQAKRIRTHRHCSKRGMGCSGGAFNPWWGKKTA